MTAIAGAWRRPGPALPVVRVARPVASWIVWSRRWAVFASALAGYLALGAHLALGLHAMHGDAYSRVTNAFYVLFSRDPHLASIGFVWPPLPSLFELAVLPLSLLWPPIVERGLAAVFMSSIFMAGAVHQVNRTLGEFAVPRAPRALLVGAFALHPMIVYYGAVGTAEAPTVFFLVLTMRHLARWLSDPAVGPLVIAGLGLAGAYLTRYEAMFSALGAAGLVALVTIARTEGRRRDRLDGAVADVAIVLAPFVLAFGGWAVASWLIVGSPFTQFTSAYGNAAQIAVSAAEGAGEFEPLADKARLAFLRVGALQVLLPLALVSAAFVGWRRRDLRWLAAIALFCPVLAFMVLGYLTDALFPWLRFFILAIPLGVLLFGLAIGGLAQHAQPLRQRLDRWLLAVARPVTVAEITLAALIAVPVAGAAMLDRTIAVAESRDLAGILGPDAARDDRPGSDLKTFATERDVAAYLDALDLPVGSVVLDAFSGFAIVGQSANPRQFVITPDRDFRPILTDPRSFGIHYLLAPAATGNGLLDAVNVAYPNLAAGRSDLAVPERSFAGKGGSGDWGLYRVAYP